MSAVAFFGTLAGGGVLPPPGVRAVLNLGTTAYYAASDTSAMNVVDNEPFSVAFRMVADDDTPSSIRTIVSKKTAADYTAGWRILLLVDGRISVAIADGTNSRSYYTTVLSAGLKNVVVTWTGSGAGWTVYVNGTSLSLTAVHTDTVGTSTGNSEPVRFGRMADDTTSFEGWIFDVAMWNGRVLDASDVAEYGTITHLEQRTDLRDMTNPPDYYVPVIETDTDGNGTGTLADYGTYDLGMTSVVTTGSEILTGEASWATGYSVSFDSTTEWLTTPVVLPSGAWSMAFWYYHTAVNNSIIGVGNYGAASSTTILALGTGEMRVRMRDTGSGDVNVITTSTPFPSASAWYHVLVTHDGTGNASGIRAYVDGAAETFSTTTDTMGSNVAGALKLGYLSVGVNTCRACEYAVWSSDVNASQTAIYNSGTRANRLTISPAPDVLYIPILSADDAGKEAGHFYDLLNEIMYRADASTADDLENVSP